MPLGQTLKDIVSAIGQGTLEQHNVATYGPDFRERRQESAARIRAQAIAEKLQQLGILQKQRELAVPEAEAAAAFPGVPTEEAIAQLGAQRNTAEFDRTQEAHERSNALAEAQVENFGSLAEGRQAQAQAAEMRAQAAVSNAEAATSRAATAAERAQAQIALAQAQQALAEARAAKVGDAGGIKVKDLDPQAVMDEAVANASRRTGLPEDQVPPEEVRKEAAAVYERYRSVFGGPAQGPRAAAPMSPGQPVGGGAPKLYKFQGQMVPWAQLPPQVQQALRAKGVGE